MNIIEFLPNNQCLNNLSTSEYEILEFIIKNQLLVSNMTVQNLADATFVSTASVMRLCKKIGYSGFSELKYKLKSQEQPPENTTKLDISDMKSIIVRDLGYMTGLINNDTIEEVTKLLLSNKNLHFYAKGITRCALTYFVKYLQTCSRKSYEYLDTHIAHLNAKNMSSNDVLIVASLSGITMQVLKTVQIAKMNGATIVSFTSMKSMNNNPIAELSDYNFYVTSHAQAKDFEFDVNSRLSMYFIIDLIIMNYLNQI